MKKIILKTKLKGDRLEIEIKRKNIEFSVFCDGDGFVVKMDKKELEDKLK